MTGISLSHGEMIQMQQAVRHEFAHEHVLQYVGDLSRSAPRRSPNLAVHLTTSRNSRWTSRHLRDSLMATTAGYRWRKPASTGLC